MSYLNNIEFFFALVRAGLWEKDVRLSQLGKIDFNEVYRLAEEQSVVGLVAAGIEHVLDVKIPQTVALKFVGSTLLLEQRNIAMNVFVAKLIEKLRDKDIQVLLVKGQGIAQCYERPLWRACGDVDFLLNQDNYDKAKELLMPLATEIETEFTHFKHQGMTIDGWVVELHGTLRTRLSKRVDDEIDVVQREVFCNCKVRPWQNENIQVLLPAPDDDVVFVFTHILHHFFIEGIGLRQICDWCRLLWAYRDTVDVTLLERRLQTLGLISEWKAFAALAVDYLDMPAGAMPLYSSDDKWKRKAKHICDFIIKGGNFGHNHRRNYNQMPYLTRKLLSFFCRLCDMLRHFSIFPKDAIVFIGGLLRSGLHAVARRE